MNHPTVDLSSPRIVTSTVGFYYLNGLASPVPDARARDFILHAPEYVVWGGNQKTVDSPVVEVHMNINVIVHRIAFINRRDVRYFFNPHDKSLNLLKRGPGHQAVGKALQKQHVTDGLLITTGDGAQCFRQDEGDEEVGDGQEELLLLAA